MVLAGHLDLIERRVATAQLAAVIQSAAGAEGVEKPDVEQVRADYLRKLAEPPKAPDAADEERRALTGR